MRRRNDRAAPTKTISPSRSQAYIPGRSGGAAVSAGSTESQDRFGIGAMLSASPYTVPDAASPQDEALCAAPWPALTAHRHGFRALPPDCIFADGDGSERSTPPPASAGAPSSGPGAWSSGRTRCATRSACSKPFADGDGDVLDVTGGSRPTCPSACRIGVLVEPGQARV
jgi:hypothetical protein